MRSLPPPDAERAELRTLVHSYLLEWVAGRQTKPACTDHNRLLMEGIATNALLKELLHRGYRVDPVPNVAVCWTSGGDFYCSVQWHTDPFSRQPPAEPAAAIEPEQLKHFCRGCTHEWTGPRAAQCPLCDDRRIKVTEPRRLHGKDVRFSFNGQPIIGLPAGVQTFDWNDDF